LFRPVFLVLGFGLVLGCVPPALAATSQHFESPPVHPVEMSPDGTRLFVVHTAGHELEVFDLTQPGGPVRIGKVPVGYEPVTVRARSDSEVWVVSHVSDAVNVVDVNAMNVVRTLHPGDEPTDVRFAQGKAFVCVSQEDKIAVYSLSDLTLPPTDIPLLQSDPRSLALSLDGSTLYVCALDSQNETTIVPWRLVKQRGGPPAPNPPMDPNLPVPFDTGLIVRFDGSQWRDEASAIWPVPYTLYDHDVIRIDTSSLAVVGQYRRVGTVLYNLGVNPVTGMIYVTNTEAYNEVRFEPNQNGQFAQNRITLIDPGTGTVTPVHLNQHINYANPAGDPTERALSLALPLDMGFSSDGSTVYVAALGSAKVGVLDAAGNVTRRIPVGPGPAGLALDEGNDRLYVVNRFASTLSVVDLTNDSSYELPLGFDPSNNVIRQGRRFLYQAETVSAHGDLACATCHVFGGMDNIGWDLGDPEGVFQPPFVFPPPIPVGAGFHPMKGPMMTQTLKGLFTLSHLHWRGERSTFTNFNPAFRTLMGAPASLPGTQFNQFELFVESMKLPPNPYRQLDGSHLAQVGSGDPTVGEAAFLTGLIGNSGGGVDCQNCHIPPVGNRSTIIVAADIDGKQDMVTPQLRNEYEKTRFSAAPGGQTVRGFGFLHDGAFESMFQYFKDFPLFNFADDQQRRDVEAFILAFNTDISPAVGVQRTLDGTNFPQEQATLSTLLQQQAGGVIGLIAKGRDGNGDARGWYRQGNGLWQGDRSADTPIGLTALSSMAGPGTEITITAVLPGEAFRLGIDRDDDGFLDRDELDGHADPDDPLSTPGAVDAPLIAGRTSGRLWLTGSNPARTESRFGYELPGAGPARLEVFDVMGRRVRSLVRDPAAAAGSYQSVWDLMDQGGSRVSAGLYFVRLSTPGGTSGQRVVVLR
jgi:YVTN family beta-propeller protein